MSSLDFRMHPQVLQVRLTAASISLSLILSKEFSVSDFHNLVNQVSKAILQPKPAVKITAKGSFLGDA